MPQAIDSDFHYSFAPKSTLHDIEESSSTSEQQLQLVKPSNLSSSVRDGLQRIDSMKLVDHHRKHKTLQFFKKHKTVKILQFLLAAYICYKTYGPGLRDPETGFVVDPSEERTRNGLILVNGSERPVIGTTKFQLLLIGIARMSAFFMYPALVLVFISKFRATTTLLAKSPLDIFLTSDMHELHVYCGWTILFFSTTHTVAHLIRWTQQGNLYLLFHHMTGITGFFIILSCFLICIPMTIFKDRIRYEIRKYMHYLFLVFAFALSFHVPISAIPNGGFATYVFGTLFLWYFVDTIYCYFYLTEKIDTTMFSVVPSGVRITMTVSEQFQKIGVQGGYCYICLPWVDKYQWHAFSLFENPLDQSERQIFIQKTGDWTNKVHHILQRDTVRPAWVQGPFPSPYNRADLYDNQILVASGIGITPALAIIRAHKNSRRINLIWVVRDQYLLQFFLDHFYFDHDGWNLIFYTGKDKLNESYFQGYTNLCIIEGRPNLKDVIPNIIYGIESKLGLPEQYTPERKAVASEMISDVLDTYDTITGTIGNGASNKQAKDIAHYAAELGFHLQVDAVTEELYPVITFDGDSESFDRPSEEVIKNHLSLKFRPWEKQKGAKTYVKGLDEKIVLRTWGMLYCGGAKKVEEDLKLVSDTYKLELHIESFGW